MAVQFVCLLIVAILLTSLHCQACPTTSINVTASLKPDWKYSITSPGFPGNYPNNITCLWRITGPPGYNILVLLDHFEIEPSSSCSNDYIVSGSIEWRVRWRNSGKCSILSSNYIESLPPHERVRNRKLSYSGSDVMFVKFRSDATSSFKGFRGEIRLGAPYFNDNCFNVLNASSGSFSSPKYPSKYPTSQSCTWLVIVPTGRKVHLKFESFTLENTQNTQGDCINDFVEIREGTWGKFGKILGRFCGDVIPPAVTSPTNQMWFQFISDGNSSSTFTGFKAQFTSTSIIPTYSIIVLLLTVVVPWLTSHD